MNAIQKVRNKKLKEEVKNELKVFKLQAEIRRNNEQQLEQELGIQKSLSDFHKPVTEKLQQQDNARKEHFKLLKDAVDNIPLAIEQPPEPPLDVYNFDNELDVEYLEKNNFPRPSKLYNKSKEALQEIIYEVNKIHLKMARQKGNIMSQMARMTEKDEEREDDLLSKADYINEHMITLADYRERLRDLQRKEKYVGKGVEDKLEILARLTDKICDGVKSKKIRNQVVDLLDALLIEGTMTNEQVKQYYKNFSLNK